MFEAAVSAGRQWAEARMLSTAGVMRKTGDMTTGPDGFEVPEWATVHAALPFRLDSGNENGQSRGVNVGGLTFEDATGVGHVPWDTTDLQDGDLLDVTGETEGVWRVVAAIAYDQKTARRLPIEEVVRPEEWA